MLPDYELTNNFTVDFFGSRKAGCASGNPFPARSEVKALAFNPLCKVLAYNMAL